MADSVTWAAALSAAAAGLGLLVNGFSALRAAKTQRLTNLTGVHGRIQDQYSKYGQVKADENTPAGPTKAILWNEAFFNELEWLCALYLRGEVPEDLMLAHFGPALVRYHDSMYLRLPMAQPNPGDPELYRSFRTVVGIFRNRIPVARISSSPASRPFRAPTPIYTRKGKIDVLA